MNIIDFAARRRYEAARAGVQVSQEDQRRLENEVAAAVASLYVSYGRSSARIDEIRANVDLFQRLRQLAVDQKNAGIGTRLDTTRADVQLARQQQALLVATNQRDFARLALLRAIGADLGAGLELTDDWTRAPLALPPLQAALDAARRQRPELTLLEQRLRLANLNIEAARAERLPTLGAQAQGTESGNRVRDIEWSRTVAAVVNVPILTGRRIEARVAEAQAQRDQLLIQQNDTERQIEQEVRQALLAYENARSRVELAGQSLKLAAGRAGAGERPIQGRRRLLDRGRQRPDLARHRPRHPHRRAGRRGPGALRPLAGDRRDPQSDSPELRRTEGNEMSSPLRVEKTRAGRARRPRAPRSASGGESAGS